MAEYGHRGRENKVDDNVCALGGVIIQRMVLKALETNGGNIFQMGKKRGREYERWEKAGVCADVLKKKRASEWRG